MKFQKTIKQQRKMLYLFIGISIVGVLSFLFIVLQPHLILTKDEITIAYQSTFEPEKIKAQLFWNDISSQVKVKSSVDPNQVGTYEVLYRVKKWGHWYQKKQMVHVADLTPPEFELQGVNPAIICPKGDYQEEGVKATDNLDRDVTDQIKTYVTDTKIVYEVTDKAGNRAMATRDLVREDTVAPELTLQGAEVLSIYQGDGYIDPGYQANDSCDGSVEVTVKGSVDTNKIGTYTITYEAMDESGNKAEKVRTVRVVAKPDQRDKVIYLTFDDGPSSTITPGVLQILKEENVKATFFVIHHSDNLNYLIKQAYEEGHTVAIHSYTHNYGQVYASEAAYFQDLNLMREKIHSITGVYSNFIRFPGGSSNTVSRFNPGIMSRLSKEVLARGYQYFDWNISSGDAGGARNSTEVYNNVVRALGAKTNIVLMHDFEGNYKTLNALRDIIRYGKQMGYTFSPITETTPAIHHGINN